MSLLNSTAHRRPLLHPKKNLDAPGNPPDPKNNPSGENLLPRVNPTVNPIAEVRRLLFQITRNRKS
jgi:hypothetical protein